MKLFRLFILSFLFSPLISTYAQNTSVEKNQFKINLLLPGFVYEHGFNDKNTLYTELSFGLGYSKGGFSNENWAFYPNIDEQFRHYYNIEKRAGKGKRTLGNSGNFYGLNAIYRFESINSNSDVSPSGSSFTIAPVWGFQRTYKHNFNLNLNGGVGYWFDKHDNGIVPVINFTIGWVIF